MPKCGDKVGRGQNLGERNKRGWKDAHQMMELAGVVINTTPLILIKVYGKTLAIINANLKIFQQKGN